VRVGIAGFGNVGRDVARRLLAGAIPEVGLIGVTAAHLDRAKENARALSPTLPALPLVELCERADAVVECATAEAFPLIARAVLGAGKKLIAVSACGVPNCPDMVELAERHGASVVIANGALPGLDIIRSAREGRIDSVQLTSWLRPESLAHEPYIRERHPVLASTGAAVQVFDGSAAQAAVAFPRHFNVAVTLSLAGVGLDRTRVTVWCDPSVKGAVHQVEVEAEDISLKLISRNLPSANARTSRIVAPSIMAALRNQVASLHIGS
jgi:aspartate dehydrogenase